MNFNWIIKNQLAASSMPHDEEDIKRISKEKVNAILCLAQESELPFKDIKTYELLLAKYGIELKHKPIIDFSAPNLIDLNECLEWIDQQLRNGKKVMVHCRAGLGRTGTVVSCYLVKKLALSAEEAINFVRRIRPGSVETYSQILAVKLYEKYVKSLSQGKP
ncbi:MAG TPA: dual specificity protein phosphatase family protein [Geobacterales bacterium]|nr:dual specificity protein phosphatase family protein [Geobacterales bacterium]